MRRLLLATALAAVTTAAAAQTAPERLAFDVLRDGEQVGTHEITLDRRADGTDVRIRTDVAVKVAFFTAYRFEHAGHEAWSRGHLAAMDTSTNDDGTRHELHVVARDAGYAVSADGAARATPALPLGSLWRADMTGATRMLNTLDGTVMQVAVVDLGPERIETASGPVDARHLSITGDLRREVWFDGDGRLARVAFAAKDGSGIVYRRR